MGAGTFAANRSPAHECRRSCRPTFSTPSGLSPSRGALVLHHLPIQAYYWSKVWQRDERESLRDIELGRVNFFETGSDAVPWLLSEDDD